MRPKHLAIELSKLKPHPCSSVELEQYTTEGDLAAFWILAIDQLDDLEQKTILDLGAGNGILGLGTAILGAAKVILIEGDSDTAEVSRENSQKIKSKHPVIIEVLDHMIGSQPLEIEEKIDIVVMNPPWGFQKERADRPLLELAFSLDATSVYVLHSINSKHLKPLARQWGYDGEIVFEADFRLPPTYIHHNKKKSSTEARCWRFFKNGDAKVPERE